MKSLLYQILIIAAVWVGMIFFLDDMDQLSKMIFYLVTSWLLLLIVILIKQVIKSKKESN